MVKNNYLFFIIIMSLASFISYTYYNPLPTNALFELLVLTSLLFLAKKMESGAWIIVCGCLFYIAYTFIIAHLNATHPKDYFLAYKSYVYLVILAFFSGKCLFSQRQVTLLFNMLLGIFLCKYILWLIFATFKRPGVFAENNFEIMTILFIALAVWAIDKKLSVTQWLTLTLVVFMSGSRSGVVAYFAMLTFLLIRNFDFKTILKLMVLGIIGVGVAGVLVSRLSGGDVSSIDRVVFAQGFLIAIKDWTWFNFLFGSTPLTALPDAVCERLVFYKTLFSAKDPNICYSVILHSYVIRQVFDHGIVGLAVVFTVINYLLKISLVPGRVRLSVVSILFLNGLSVSSINSVYALVGIVVIMTTLYPHRYEFEKKRLQREKSNNCSTNNA